MHLHPSRLAAAFGTCLLAATAALAEAPATGEWSGLRGPSFDGAFRLARLADPGAPLSLSIAWKKPIGSGYSGVAVAGGRAVTMFASGDADVAAAFDVATGNEIWRYRIADAYKGHDGSHDGPISTPAISGGRVFGLGPRGQLFALDAATGKPIWEKNVAEAHAGVKPHYGFTTSPIVVEDVLIVEIGAKEGKAVAGFAAADGALLWSALDDEIAYHSPIAATIGGRAQVVAAGKKKIAGLEPKSGKVLWSHTHDGDDAAMGGETIIPVPAGEGRFFLINKIDSSVMLRVAPEGGDAWKVETLWSNNAIKSSYVIPVYHDGHLYGVSGRIVTCVDAATGETKWKSREPGDGFPTLVGSHLVFLTKPGTLHVAEASPAGYTEAARLDLFAEHAWAAPSFADGHIYARSMGHIARIDVAAGGGGTGGGRNWVASTPFGRFLDEARKAGDRKAFVEAWLSRQKSFPVVEDDGAVHFVWKGEATDVGIVGDMVGFRREDPMTRLEGTDLFHYSTRLEPDAAVTYGYIVDYGKAAPDPRNPRPGRGAFGEVSLLTMPAWRGGAAAAEAPKDRQGRLETVEWESKVHEGKKRTLEVYLPAGFDPKDGRRYPVLYVHDGRDALDQGGWKNLLDAAIGSTVRPLIAVFVIPDAENPRRDLGQSEKYVEMFVKEIVPLVEGKYPTLAGASEKGAVGTATGGYIALAALLKHPDLLGRAGALGTTLMKPSDLEVEIPSADERPAVIYLGWGTYGLRSPHEAWDMVRGNRELWSLLREKGYRPAGGESPEGVGWAIWRGRLEEMVRTLFPLRDA